MNFKTLALVAGLGLGASANAACPTWADSLGMTNGQETCGLNDAAPYSGNLLLSADKYRAHPQAQKTLRSTDS